MSFVVTEADRSSFRRCRRQWDFGAGTRQNLEPARPPRTGDLDRALREALAVYYYPGMWDWDRGVRLPLVVQGSAGPGCTAARRTWPRPAAAWVPTSNG